MFQTPAPDLGAPRRLILTGLIVCLTVWVLLALLYGPHLGSSLGDTDDAMRLALVRDLLHGRGWYDQSVQRLQPPVGSYMHWSRLIDGGLAGLTLLLSPVLGAGAETGARLIWPMLWIVPAVGSSLVLARRLGGGRAVFPAAVMLAVGLPLYAQFAPGRVDHHNAQIALCLMAAAAVVEDGMISAVIAGVAMAAGLAVGLEALLFCALVGFALALRFVMGDERRRTVAFGLSLAASASLVFLMQTPPQRWGLAVCDAMGANLVLGLVVAGLGLAAAAPVGRWGPKFRALAVAGVGGVALAAYLCLDPSCWRGPMAEIDPRLYPIWLGHVTELMNWPQLFRSHPDRVAVDAFTGILGLGALAIGLKRRADFGWVFVGALFLLALALAATAARMESYLLWLAVPLLAAALTEAAATKLNGALVPTLALALVVSAMPVDVLADAAFARQSTAQAKVNLADHCYDSVAYDRLASLPKGLALSEIDLGPYILARSPNAILNAPYHRMSWGILAAQAALTARPLDARARLQALHVDYVVACPAHAGLYTHLTAPPGSLLRALDRGEDPTWLKPLSTQGEPLRLYRVM